MEEKSIMKVYSKGGKIDNIIPDDFHDFLEELLFFVDNAL